MVSILEIFDKEFLYSPKFSLAESVKIIAFNTMITTTGIKVIKEIKVIRSSLVLGTIFPKTKFS